MSPASGLIMYWWLCWLVEIRICFHGIHVTVFKISQQNFQKKSSVRFCFFFCLFIRESIKIFWAIAYRYRQGFIFMAPGVVVPKQIKSTITRNLAAKTVLTNPMSFFLYALCLLTLPSFLYSNCLLTLSSHPQE